MVIENRSWQYLLMGSPILQHCQVRSFYPVSLPVLVYEKAMKLANQKVPESPNFSSDYSGFDHTLCI